jgi:hypothetical protein
MKKTITLYVATKKIWGSDFPRYHYFETIAERNAFVRDNDYADKAGTVKLTVEQYEEWKQFGEWWH